MRFTQEKDAIDFIFRSRRKVQAPRGLDEHTRSITPTRNMMLTLGLPATAIEYAVVTGSKGKGSVTAITAKLLQSLGHRTGTISSPHMVSWMERIRINGHAIPQADFLRILSDLAPVIEAEDARLVEGQVISPQGIFLLIALRWFDESGVKAAVLEVGRGGRFDDISLVPNKVALFTPIIMEHARYLGDSLERIAWHKSGIIKTGGYVYSLPQAPQVLDVISREAEARSAEFYWLSNQDMGQYLGDTPDGLRMRLQRYGEIELPLMGRYMIENATLAVQAAGNMHARLQGISHSSPEYVARIRTGLETVRWPGRLQKLQDHPAVYVDGAVNVLSVRNMLQSLADRISAPLITIAGVPEDRDYDAVYSLLAEKSQALILTESAINPNIGFPQPDAALTAARYYCEDVSYRATLPEALELAYEKAGADGTVLLAVAQPLVGEAMLIWNVPMQDI